MATPTVTETVYSGGGTLAKGRVEITLVSAAEGVLAGYAANSNLTFMGTRYVELVDGVWSAVLKPNVGTSTDVVTYPNGSTGTRWKVVTRLDSMGPGETSTRYLKVPDTAGTFQAQDLDAHGAPPAPRLVVADDFSTYAAGATITNSSYYVSGTFPFNGGANPVTNPSNLWETGNGGLYEDNGWGYSRTPLAAGTANHFRATMLDFTVKHQMVKWKYKSAAYGVGGYTVTGTEAIDVWLRYITEYNLYALQFDRTDGRIYLKRKVPADAAGFTAHPAWIANSGVYFIVPTDAQQPVFGAASPYATWVGQSLSPPQHNATSTTGAVYDCVATIDTIGWSGGLPLVQVQLWRDGILCGSWTDSNNGIAPTGGTTLADSVTANEFTAVTGYQSTWYAPTDSHGGTGFRADNIQTWIKDVELWDLDG